MSDSECIGSPYAAEPEAHDEYYDIVDAPWLVQPDGAPEPRDGDVKVPIEPPYVTKLRDAPEGLRPFIVAPGSADWAPPDLLAVRDTSVVETNTERRNAMLEQDNGEQGQVRLPAAQRRYLDEAAHDAAKKLLQVLDRGMEASSRELDEAVLERRRKRDY
jgi:hypothetical protein